MKFLLDNWLLILVALTSGVMLAWPSLSRRGGSHSVTAGEAVRLINREKAVLIDVSEPAEYAAGHVAGARSVPLASLEGSKNLPSNKALPLVVVCPTGARASRAVATLRKLGFENAHALAGGLACWREANLPIEKTLFSDHPRGGRRPPPPRRGRCRRTGGAGSAAAARRIGKGCLRWHRPVIRFTPRLSAGFGVRRTMWCRGPREPYRMRPVKMYTTQVCPFCQRAKLLLKQRGVEAIDEIRVDLEPAQRETLLRITGRRTVPQIFIGETHVGGCDDLMALDARGGLMPLLRSA
jgi:GrxC family glutaredoxin